MSSRDREQEQPRATPLLHSLRVLELGPALAGAVCGRMFAELGADVIKVDSPETGPAVAGGQEIDLALNSAKRRITLNLAAPDGRSESERLIGDADLIVCTFRPSEMERLGVEPPRLQALNPRAVVVAITPFGLTGPYRDYRGGDLVAFHASGVARLLIGKIEDPEAEPPVRAAGEQSEFIAGITAACAAMHGVYAQGNGGPGQLIDVSVQEAMACMSVRELAAPAYGSPATSRHREFEGGGAVVTVLPARDGHVVISPREHHQWQAWIGVLG